MQEEEKDDVSVRSFISLVDGICVCIGVCRMSPPSLGESLHSI